MKLGTARVEVLCIASGCLPRGAPDPLMAVVVHSYAQQGCMACFTLLVYFSRIHVHGLQKRLRDCLWHLEEGLYVHL